MRPRFGIKQIIHAAPKLAVVAGVLAMPVLAAASDNPLVGCWRSQQVRYFFTGGKWRDQNTNCTLQADAKRIRTQCMQGSEKYDSSSSYEIVSPNTIRVTPSSALGTKPSLLKYQVDGEWLMTSRVIDAPVQSVSDRPERMSALSVRVPIDADCTPRNASSTRIPRTSVSSLSLGTPPGWESSPLDPTTDPLSTTINTSFFIGAFVPTNAPKKDRQSSQPLVVVLDDTRYGPTPVRSEEFVAVRRRFAEEVGSMLACDLRDRACALMRKSDGSSVYTELAHVRGRVVMVNSTMLNYDTAADAAMRSAVKIFIDQLRKDNPE